MIRAGEKVFVDTGPWIALADRDDPLHGRALGHWKAIGTAGARLVTSVPVVIETFTFVDRRSGHADAVTWRKGLDAVPRLEILDCTSADLADAWRYLDRKDFHKLGVVDATSFVLMRRHRIRVAFAFDIHFAVAGFRYLS